MKEKVELLERSVARHDDQIARLFSKVDSVNGHLIDIQKTLDQIRYIGMGMLFYFIISEIGFIEGMKVVS